MAKMLTEEEALSKLRNTVDRCGGMNAAARDLRVTGTCVSEVLSGKKRIGKKLAQALGLDLVVLYKVK